MTFSEVWNTHKTHLLGFIKTKIDDQSIAEDILQEVGIKLLDNLKQKKVIRNPKAWLFQVTRNTIADYYRKNKKYTETLMKVSEVGTSSSNCVCDLTGFVIQNYLPKKYSEPLYLSDIEQRPQQEIAQMLSLSLTATKSRILRARKKLRDLVSECVDFTFTANGQIADFQLKNNCSLPQELKAEMKRMNLIL